MKTFLSKCTQTQYNFFITRCTAGYSEALFSAKCVQNEDCNSQWILIVLIFMAGAYAAFLLFQKDLKDFIIGAHLKNAPSSKKLEVNEMQEKCNNAAMQPGNPPQVAIK